MAAWHYDLFLVATGPLDSGPLKARLSRDLPVLKSPTSKLLLWGDAEGDRIDFWVDHTPPQFLARFDLRTPSDSFRRLVLDVAREFSLQLLNAEDGEIAGNDAALTADMRASAAHAAATNPPAEDEENGEQGEDEEP
ncbi:hypothetical protein Pan44_07150 [Caulifigura coniformis]|uniref:Uncharacterized protein n=1 Tax=Caulifigura coniformis TaxID=2527983 RepID=A0A517S9B3_9PLAN|nr:hypothetical protein [Caulifigura coniformis]QDT52703.1 hypothetical protein Pan44_07150 [Caulifigura coniformis]